MRDNLDLQELRERIEHYKAKHRDIRNKTLFAFIMTFVITGFIWFQPEASSSSQTYIDFLNVWNLSIALFPLIIIMILLIVWLAPRQKLAKERSQRAQKFLTQFLAHESDSDTDEVEESDNPAEKKDRDNVFTVLVIATIIASVVDASWIIIYLLLSSMPFYLLMKYPIRGWQVKDLTADEKAYVLHEARIRGGFFLGLLVFNLLVVVGLELFIQQLILPFTMDTLLMATTLIGMFVFEIYVFNLWYQRITYFKFLFAGQYDNLLDMINYQAKISGHDLHYWEAIIRQFKGESAEAETLWHELLEMAKDGANIQMVSLALNNIGYTLIAQDRVAESLSYFEASIRLYPDFTTLYRGLMGYYDRMGVHPERALEIGQFMMTITQKPRSNLAFAFSEWANNLSAMAVAYANVGDRIQSRAYLSQAFEIADTRFKSNMAGLHNSAGHIDSVEGNLDEARQHYEQAIEIDPKGVTAMKARKYLAELSS